jgi:hypothetical protein
MKVDPPAIRRFADGLGQAGDNAVTARDYGSRYGNLSFEQEGLLATARFVHGDFLQTLTDTLNHLGDILRTSKAELYKAADYYQQSNADAVARADSAFPVALRQVPMSPY